MLALYAHGRPVADERHPVETEDGWLLTLHRYLPADGAVRQPVPIVLGHGINMNRTAFELSRRGSMARALAARGHDVFVAEYRGEPSARPPLRGDNARKRWAYTLMDHAQHDLPAIIDTAARLGRSDRVSWVGHSMGGILLYLYASLHGSGKLVGKCLDLKAAYKQCPIAPAHSRPDHRGGRVLSGHCSFRSAPPRRSTDFTESAWR